MLRRDRRILMVSAAASLVLFAGACSSGDDGNEADPTPSTEATAGPSISPAGGFDQATVLKTVVADDTIVVHLVDEEGDDDPAELLQECTAAFQDEADGVTCYLFESTEAFSAAGVSDDGDEMENECWLAYYGVGEEGGRGELENPDYDDEAGCP